MSQDILVLTATLGERATLDRTVESVRVIGGDRVKHVIICPQKNIDTIRDKYGDVDCIAEPKGCNGIYAALNYGFNLLGKQFKYLSFINDDDYWLPDFLVLIETITNDNDIDFVYGRVNYVNENNKKIGIQACYPILSAFIPLLQRGVVMFTQQATLIKSSLFFKIGGFDENYKLVADTKFWAQLSMMNVNYRYVNKACCAYMIQSGQLSSDHKLQMEEHARLVNELNYRGRAFMALCRYRVFNMSVYLKRCFCFKGHIKTPFSLHKGCVFKVMIIFLPWKLRRYILNKYFLYDISPSAHIGLSYIYPDFLKMGDNAKIGHFNVGIHLSKIVMGCNSILGRSNWITGFPLNTNSQHFSHDKNRKPELILGEDSAITKNHHFDCTNSIHIGKYVTIAGYSSQFLTHSIDIYENRQDSHPITIGDYCLVSTRVIVLGGAVLPSCSVLAAGAVLNKPYTEQYKIYAGVPALAKKSIDPQTPYFLREIGFVF